MYTPTPHWTEPPLEGTESNSDSTRDLAGTLETDILALK